MADEIRVNRPVTSQPGIRQEQPGQEMKPKKSSKLPWIILVVVVAVLAVLGVLFRDKLFGSGKGSAGNVKYQAVFLTNGQVYFGKLTDADSEYLTLTDIYYLQVVQPALQGQQPNTATQTPSTTEEQPQISLVKLGNELHGPVDEMHISRAQVLFYEDLKNDGKVAGAIDSYKANPQGGSAVPSK